MTKVSAATPARNVQKNDSVSSSARERRGSGPAVAAVAERGREHHLQPEDGDQQEDGEHPVQPKKTLA